MPTRKASAKWEGGLKGKGTFKGETGAIDAAYNFSSRFENGTGSNPEELLAAAEAACFSMALALGLEKEGVAATSVETSAACTVAPQSGGGFKITTMVLDVRASVPGIDAEKFRQIAEATKEGCPVSKALKGNVDITLNAQLV
jgi:lipoyl-dependent peroxiredoxin